MRHRKPTSGDPYSPTKIESKCKGSNVESTEKCEKKTPVRVASLAKGFQSEALQHAVLSGDPY